MANGTALCQYVQLYRYFVSQPNEFCHNSPLCRFWVFIVVSIYFISSVWKLLDTPSYQTVKSFCHPTIAWQQKILSDFALKFDGSECKGDKSSVHTKRKPTGQSNDATSPTHSTQASFRVTFVMWCVRSSSQMYYYEIQVHQMQSSMCGTCFRTYHTSKFLSYKFIMPWKRTSRNAVYISL